MTSVLYMSCRLQSHAKSCRLQFRQKKKTKNDWCFCPDGPSWTTRVGSESSHNSFDMPEPYASSSFKSGLGLYIYIWIVHQGWWCTHKESWQKSRSRPTATQRTFFFLYSKLIYVVTSSGWDADLFKNFEACKTIFFFKKKKKISNNHDNN